MSSLVLTIQLLGYLILTHTQICPKNCDFRCFAKFDQLVGCALFWGLMGPTRRRDYHGCCQGKESNTAGMGRALFIIDNPGTTAIRMGSESFFSEARPVFVAKDNQGQSILFSRFGIFFCNVIFLGLKFHQPIILLVRLLYINIVSSRQFDIFELGKSCYLKVVGPGKLLDFYDLDKKKLGEGSSA